MRGMHFQRYSIAVNGCDIAFLMVILELYRLVIYDHFYSTKMSDNAKSLDRRHIHVGKKKNVTHEHTHKIVSVHCQSLHAME